MCVLSSVAIKKYHDALTSGPTLFANCCIFPKAAFWAMVNHLKWFDETVMILFKVLILIDPLNVFTPGLQ